MVLLGVCVCVGVLVLVVVLGGLVVSTHCLSWFSFRHMLLLPSLV